MQRHAGRPFAPTAHLRRLERSCAGLGLAAPDEDAVRAAVREVLAALGTAAPQAPRGPGQRVVTVPWTRNERSAVAGRRTTSYAEDVVALARAHARGAGEALPATTRGRCARAPEVLLTSSTRDVQPLVALDDRPLVTSDLGRAAVEPFARRRAQDDDPHP